MSDNLLKDVLTVSWPDKIRVIMLDKSSYHDCKQVYEYGYYDGYQKAREILAPEVIRLMKQPIEFCKFRDTYKRYENQAVHIEQVRLGGIFSWIGASDEKIYEAFLKGEQLENPLILKK